MRHDVRDFEKSKMTTSKDQWLAIIIIWGT
jgi:hypothetical protein